MLELLAEVPATPRDRAVTGAEVAVEGRDGSERRFLILPGGDGTDHDGVTVVSPQSPVARALFGLEEGDEAELLTGGVEITAID